MLDSRFLTVAAVLSPGGLELEPGYLVEHVPSRAESPFGDGLEKLDEAETVTVVLTDDAERQVWRSRLPILPICVAGAKGDPVSMVAGAVPFPDTTRTVAFYRDDRELYAFAVAEHGPKVSPAWPDELTGRQRVTWEMSHPEARDVRATVCYSRDDGRTWTALTPSQAASEAEVDFDALPGGDACRLSILVTDGGSTVRAVSERLPVPVKPCLATILSPTDGEVVPNQEVWFHGQGLYLEESATEEDLLEWHSSIDGRLGAGTLLRVSSLNPGRHVITLVAGPAGRQGTAQIAVETTGEATPG